MKLLFIHLFGCVMFACATQAGIGMMLDQATLMQLIGFILCNAGVWLTCSVCWVIGNDRS